MTRDEHIGYWKESALEDMKVMESLYEKGHYAWALFIGHLVLEKLLKALYVQQVGETVPFVHNLLKLARESGLDLTDAQEEFLLEVTAYNIKGRYPDYKKEFQRIATAAYTVEKINSIKEFAQWLLQKIPTP